MEQARSEGLSLTGADGLLTAVTRRVIEAALEAEMTEHLGYAKGDRAAAAETEGGNHRNGTSRKTVHTDIGQVTVDVPRDRAGQFEPRIVPKRARRVAGFDEAVVSLYAKGLTTGEIRARIWPRSMAQRSRGRRSRRSPTPWPASWRNGSPARSIACTRS